ITSQLIGRGVNVGDIIWIDAETGRVTKIGVSDEKGTKYDIGVSRKIPIPSGPIAKEKEFIYTVTLHDLDTMQARSSGLVSLIFGAREEKEISPEIRQRVDETVKKWVDEGTAQIIPGVLFIDDVHMLDIEALSFLSRAMEGELSPIIILASNRGFTKIRGTDIVSPHGLPLDLLDRLLIIETKPYNRNEIKEILKIRAKEEKVNLSEEGLENLTDIGVKYSLRYAVQLLTPASIIAKSKGRDRISPEDINHVKELFVDLKRSADYLKKYEEEFLR
ncbi:MAG: TATA box-binding protein, partial [Thermoprotei archaeon]